MHSKYFKINLVIVFSSFVSCLPIAGNTQTLKTIDDLEQAGQKHLDEGVNRLKYMSALYLQMDSLLNVVYKKLQQQLSANEKETLKIEQRAWIKKRDAFFEQKIMDEEEKKRIRKSEWHELEYLDMYVAEIEFVKERDVALIKMLNNPK